MPNHGGNRTPASEEGLRERLVGAGYTVEYERTGYPHGITKLHMVKHVTAAPTAA